MALLLYVLPISLFTRIGSKVHRTVSGCSCRAMIALVRPSYRSSLLLVAGTRTLGTVGHCPRTVKMLGSLVLGSDAGAGILVSLTRYCGLANGSHQTTGYCRGTVGLRPRGGFFQLRFVHSLLTSRSCRRTHATYRN